MKNLLITGATGIIGSAIVEEAVKQNYKVTCLIRRGTARSDNIPKSENVACKRCTYVTSKIDNNVRYFEVLTFLTKYFVYCIIN